MKLIIISMVLLFNSLSADEIHRIDSIVNDIDKLRSDYSTSQQELKAYKRKFKAEQEKNEILEKQLKSHANFIEKETSYEEQLLNLKNDLKIANKLLKTKELWIENNHVVKNKKVKIIFNKRNSPLNQTISDKNIFPKLQMKKKFLRKKRLFKASAFRLNKNAIIYNKAGGSKITNWKKGVSFTSNQKTKEWVKITGYFVNKKWVKSNKSMWIKLRDVTIRDKG